MKKILSVLICFVLLFSLSITASAAGITKVTVNEEWNESWSSSTQQNMFLFECTETGFYDVVFKDANKTAALWIDVEYETDDEYDNPLYGRINFQAYNKNEYIVEQIWFTEGRTYEVSLTYYTILANDPEYNTIFNSRWYYSDGEYKDANISVLFKPSEKEIFVLNNQENYFEINDGFATWFEFTTTDAGDYLFKNNFDIYNDDFYGECEIYEAASFKALGYADFDNNNTIFYDLKANTKYYLAINLEGNVSKYSKLSISRVTNPIIELLDIELPYDIDPCDPHGYSYAYYKVLYENGNEEWLSTDEIKYIGYNISNLYYEGESPEYLVDDPWSYSDGVLYPAGEQEFSVTFRGEDYYFYVNIQQLWQYFSDLNYTSPDKDCIIEYEDNEVQSYYWRVKTNISGNYRVYSYGGFSSFFDYYCINVIDSTNHCVEWKDGVEFYLQAGEEYLINIRYRYIEGEYDDVEWGYYLKSTPGDIDGIEGVTDRDAVYLLYHTFLPSSYPVNQDCDFNKDGEINDKDAIYLLYHTFLPESYPIN